jgi:hypothetical protein
MHILVLIGSFFILNLERNQQIIDVNIIYIDILMVRWKSNLFFLHDHFQPRFAILLFIRTNTASHKECCRRLVLKSSELKYVYVQNSLGKLKYTYCLKEPAGVNL